MLKFNISFLISLYTNHINLNTSYVKVQPEEELQKIQEEKNLNTSYVKVQPSTRWNKKYKSKI